MTSTYRPDIRLESRAIAVGGLGFGKDSVAVEGIILDKEYLPYGAHINENAVAVSGVGFGNLSMSTEGFLAITSFSEPGAEFLFEGVEMYVTRQNSYDYVLTTIGWDWTDWIWSRGIGSVNVYLTAKKRLLDSNSDALFDVEGRLQQENILFNLSVNDTDIPTGDEYKWQVQVRDGSGTVVKTPIGGTLVVKPILRRLV
jgi:hypothetical protein